MKWAELTLGKIQDFRNLRAMKPKYVTDF